MPRLRYSTRASSTSSSAPYRSNSNAESDSASYSDSGSGSSSESHTPENSSGGVSRSEPAPKYKGKAKSEIDMNSGENSRIVIPSTTGTSSKTTASSQHAPTPLERSRARTKGKANLGSPSKLKPKPDPNNPNNPNNPNDPNDPGNHHAHDHVRTHASTHGHTYSPKTYKATKNEVGVFTTEGYSEHVKHLWKFKDAVEAKKSAKAIWGKFELYRDQSDFVGMDICRKFIQMGRTRSLRYALRPSGRKYNQKTGEENKRTGKVYDQAKLDGANVYEGYLERCWDDDVYSKAWERWKGGDGEDLVPPALGAGIETGTGSKAGAGGGAKDEGENEDEAESHKEERTEEVTSRTKADPKGERKLSAQIEHEAKEDSPIPKQEDENEDGEIVDRAKYNRKRARSHPDPTTNSTPKRKRK